MVSLLLDIDGVLIRNKPLLKHVGHNCTKFVQKSSRQPIEYNMAAAINAKLYKTHGHTLRGLSVMYGPKYSSEDMYSTFNKFVYDESTLGMLATHLQSKEFLKDVEGFAEIADVCVEKKAPICLFSNAPESWCEPVCVALEDIVGSRVCIQMCAHDTMYPHYLKPDAEAYANVRRQVSSNSGNENGNGKHLIFVDDTLKNLIPVACDSQRWTPVLYNPQSNTDIGFTSFKTANKMKDIAEIVKERSIHFATAAAMDTNEKEEKIDLVNVYMYHMPVKNFETMTLLLRSCAPSLTDIEIKQIIMATNMYGNAHIIKCPRDQADSIASCLIDNGLVATIEEI